MSCKKAVYSNQRGNRKVAYQEDDGRTIVQEGGSRSWRNNNPGNLKGAVSRRVGTDAGGFDIYPDEKTGEEACRRMFEPGGKYHSYGNIRQVLSGLTDRDGKPIKGTGYAPSSDSNYPDRYAEHIRKFTGIDVDNKRIADLTLDEKNRLVDAIKREERWIIGTTLAYDQQGKLIDNYIPGTNNLQKTEEDYCEGWGSTLSP